MLNRQMIQPKKRSRIFGGSLYEEFGIMEEM